MYKRQTYGQDPFGGAGTTSGSTVLGKLSAGYRLSPEWRVYANAAQGYKPGGYNLAPSNPADARPFGKERGVSYEAGARFDGDTLRGGAALYLSLIHIFLAIPKTKINMQNRNLLFPVR